MINARGKLTYVTRDDRILRRTIIHVLELVGGKRMLERLYDAAFERSDRTGESFWESALHCLAITLDCSFDHLDSVPNEGPLVVIANHPFGILDGLIVCELTARLRPHFRVLIHSALCREERLEEYFLPIDFAPTRAAQQTNIDSKRRALETLEAGQAVIIFPAGGVSTARGLFGPVVDLEWKSFVAKLIHRAHATVLPLYVHGHNSRTFQIASQVSETIRLALFMREVRNKIGERVKVEIGQPLSYAELSHYSRSEMTGFLHCVTHGLAEKRTVGASYCAF